MYVRFMKPTALPVQTTKLILLAFVSSTTTQALELWRRYKIVFHLPGTMEECEVFIEYFNKEVTHCDSGELSDKIKDHIYRMVIVEDCCTMTRSSSLGANCSLAWLTQKYSEFWLVRYNGLVWSNIAVPSLLPFYIDDPWTK